MTSAHARVPALPVVQSDERWTNRLVAWGQTLTWINIVGGLHLQGVWGVVVVAVGDHSQTTSVWVGCRAGELSFQDLKLSPWVNRRNPSMRSFTLTKGKPEHTSPWWESSFTTDLPWVVCPSPEFLYNSFPCANPRQSEKPS